MMKRCPRGEASIGLTLIPKHLSLCALFTRANGGCFSLPREGK